MHIFELSSRESILKIDHTLRERLNTLVKKSNGQFPDLEKNEEIKNLTNNDRKREI